jgi:hypothetical protein
MNVNVDDIESPQCTGLAPLSGVLRLRTTSFSIQRRVVGLCFGDRRGMMGC